MNMLVFSQRHLIAMLNFASLAAFCALAAHWTWIVFAPDPIALLAQAEKAPQESRVDKIVASHVFGGGAPNGQSRLPPGLRLDGIFAPARGKPGAAIFTEEGRGSRAVLVGNEVVPGFLLEAIAADHAVLLHDGEKTMLRLRQIAPDLDLEAK